MTQFKTETQSVVDRLTTSLERSPFEAFFETWKDLVEKECIRPFYNGFCPFLQVIDTPNSKSQPTTYRWLQNSDTCLCASMKIEQARRPLRRISFFSFVKNEENQQEKMFITFYDLKEDENIASLKRDEQFYPQFFLCFNDSKTLEFFIRDYSDEVIRYRKRTGVNQLPASCRKFVKNFMNLKEAA